MLKVFKKIGKKLLPVLVLAVAFLVCTKAYALNTLENEDDSGYKGQLFVSEFNNPRFSEFLMPVASDNKNINSAGYLKLLSKIVEEKLAAGQVIVMLDPGHGGTDPGASVYFDGTTVYPSAPSNNPNAYKVTEALLNYKISVATRDALSTYNGVTVLMTRNWDLNTKLEVGTRCEMAAEAGAILLVSQHLNISTKHDAHGAEVWCQNSNYRADLGAWSKEFGVIACKHLQSLGLYSRGAKTKNAEREKYDDGSVADYYGINRYAKKLGVTSVIIEHAFMDHQTDFVNFLSTDEKLNNLGMADSNAIAEFLGLGEPEGELGAATIVDAAPNGPNSIEIKFIYESEVRPTGYALYRSTEEYGEYTKVTTVTNSETSIVDPKAEPGVLYYYKVLPFINRITGYREGIFSNVMSAKALGTPIMNEITRVSSTGIYISYTGSNNMDGYVIYRATAGDSAFTEIARTESLNYVDSSVEAGKVYAYKVQSYATVNGAISYSGLSNAKMIGTQMEYIRYMSGTEVQIGWTPLEGVQGYNVYRKAYGEKTYTLLEKRAASWLPQYVDKTVKEGVKYEYMVCATIKVGSEEIESEGALIETGEALDTPKITKAQCYLQSGAVVIAWSRVEGAQGYQLYRAEKASDAIEKLATISGGANVTYTDTTASKDKVYLYYVRAFTNADSKTNYSSMSDFVMSSVPIRGAVQNGDSAITVGWVKKENVSGYYIYRREGYKGNFELIAEKNAESDTYLDENVKKNTTYCYKVVGYRSDSVTTDGKTVTHNFVSMEVSYIGCKLAGAPSITKCKRVSGENKIEIEWKEVSGAVSYEIYRAKDINEESVLIDTVKTNSYVDVNGIEADTTYFYYVKALFNKNDVAGSTGLSELAMSGVGLTGLHALDSKSIEMTWPKSATYDGIKIYRKKHAAKNYTQIATIAKSEGKYVDKSLAAGQIYDYKLVTYIKENGKKVDQDSIVVTCQTLYTPTLSGATMRANGGVNLTWTRISAASGYEIYRSSTGKSGSFELVGEVEGAETLKFLDESAEKNKMYYYTVRAILKNGSQVSRSSYCSYKISTVSTPVIKGMNTESIKVTWVDVEGATKYTLYRRVDGGKYSVVKTFKPGVKEYLDKDVKLGKKYEYKIVVTDGKYTSGYSYGYAVTLLEKVNDVRIWYDSNSHIVTIAWPKIEGADRYEIYRRSEEEEKYTKLVMVSNQTNFEDKTATNSEHYYYRVRALGYQNSVTQYGTFSDPERADTIIVKPGEEGLTPIMGYSAATMQQMIKYFNKSGKKFPDTYACEEFGNVKTIEEFVKIVIQEAEMEGVRADVLCCQIFKETGFLQFGGDVKPEQCNFGGIGATGGGAVGNSFPNVRIGIRAQVQHLKLYACEDPQYKNEIVDPRFYKGIAGTAKYVEWLGINENPNGKGWATGKNYGYSIVEMMKVMASLQ